MPTIEERVIRVIAELLCIEQSQVAPEKSLANNLGADSLDEVEIRMAIEDDFAISIPDEDTASWKTVGDIITYVTGRLK